MDNKENMTSESSQHSFSNLHELRDFVKKQYEREKSDELKEIYEKLEKSLQQGH